MSMEYIIVFGSGMAEILERVQYYIDIGYEPIGGVAVLAEGTGATFYQAMIKK